MNLNLTILGQAISLALFVFFCMKFVWPPVTAALADRKKRVTDGLEAADQARLRLQEADTVYQNKIAKARKEAGIIIDKAHKQVDHLIADAKQKAESEADRIKANAYLEIDQHTNTVKTELRKQMADLIAIGVEKLITEKLDAKMHQAYINQLAEKL